MRPSSHPYIAVEFGAVLCMLLAGCQFRSLEADEADASIHPVNDSHDLSTGLIIEPKVIRFGTDEEGRRVVSELRLSNKSEFSFNISKIETSCPCLTVEPLSVDIAPHRAARLLVIFDSSSEPGFRGNLSIDIVGKSIEGESVFSAKAEITVTEPVRAGTGSIDRMGG